MPTPPSLCQRSCGAGWARRAPGQPRPTPLNLCRSPGPPALRARALEN